MFCQKLGTELGEPRQKEEIHNSTDMSKNGLTAFNPEAPRGSGCPKVGNFDTDW